MSGYRATSIRHQCALLEYLDNLTRLVDIKFFAVVVLYASHTLGVWSNYVKQVPSSFHKLAPCHLLLILDSEIVEDGFIVILSGETGVGQIAVNMAPLTQATIVEHFQFIGDDEGDNTTA